MSRELRKLEENQLISRKAYDEVLPKVEYSLTGIGETLMPILDQLSEWGKKYNEDTNYGKIQLHHGCEA